MEEMVMEVGVWSERGLECKIYIVCFFFFQAEDGIRDWSVTGVQTCALPIYLPMGKDGQLLCSFSSNKSELWVSMLEKAYMKVKIGRASCRERV